MKNIEHMVVTVIGTYTIPSSMKKSEKHVYFQITLLCIRHKQDFTSYISPASLVSNLVYFVHNGRVYIFLIGLL